MLKTKFFITLLFLSSIHIAHAEHVINPYLESDIYVNADYSHEIEYSIQHAENPLLVQKMRLLQTTPTAIWLDRIEAINGGKDNNQRLSLEAHLMAALAQKHQAKPMLVELILYNLPNRDCSALSSNGSLDFHRHGVQIYQQKYIDRIAKTLEDPRFKNLRFVLMIEPDSLPNMVTNLWHPSCQEAFKNHVYEQSIAYAIKRLHKHPNNYLYVDIGHSGWLGWDQNMQKTVAYFTQIIGSADSKAGLNSIDGFVTNISGSTPTEEIFLPHPELNIQGKPIKSSQFYSWNPHFDEKSYIESLYENFTHAGFSKHIKFLVDTSRNGWGGSQRPHNISKATQLNDYVSQSRLDRRFHRGNWCNPSGAGLGTLPTINPYGDKHPIAAFVWAKPPGESDGSSNAKQTTADDEGKHYDPMCNPNYIVDYGPNPSQLPTGALADAPASGHWFHKQFMMLINNAYPPLVP